MKWVFPDEELPALNKRILVATKGGAFMLAAPVL